MASLHAALLGHAKHYASVLGVVDQLFSQGNALKVLRCPRRKEGITLSNLGRASAALGELDQAINYHEQALLITLRWVMNAVLPKHWEYRTGVLSER